MRGSRQYAISILKWKKSIRSSEYCLDSRVYKIIPAAPACGRKPVTMLVKGDGRLGCATPQKWVTWHFVSCTASEWHQSSSSTLAVRLEECANTVIDEKRSKISQPVLNGTTNRTRPGQYVNSIVGDGSHGRPRRPEFTFQFREGVLTQTWCSSYVNRDSGLLHLRTESKILLKFMESGNRV